MRWWSQEISSSKSRVVASSSLISGGEVWCGGSCWLALSVSLVACQCNAMEWDGGMSQKVNGSLWHLRNPPLLYGCTYNWWYEVRTILLFCSPHRRGASLLFPRRRTRTRKGLVSGLTGKERKKIYHRSSKEEEPVALSPRRTFLLRRLSLHVLSWSLSSSTSPIVQKCKR